MKCTIQPIQLDDKSHGIFKPLGEVDRSIYATLNTFCASLTLTRAVLSITYLTRSFPRRLCALFRLCNILLQHRHRCCQSSSNRVRLPSEQSKHSSFQINHQKLLLRHPWQDPNDTKRTKGLDSGFGRRGFENIALETVLSQDELGQVELGQVELGQVELGQVRLNVDDLSTLIFNDFW